MCVTVPFICYTQYIHCSIQTGLAIANIIIIYFSAQVSHSLLKYEINTTIQYHALYAAELARASTTLIKMKTKGQSPSP